jgi:methionyl-tRNA synthetase
LMTTTEDELQTLKLSSLNVATSETIKDEITNHFENFASKFLIDIQFFISTVNDNIVSIIQKIFNNFNMKIGRTCQWIIIFLKYPTSFSKDNR